MTIINPQFTMKLPNMKGRILASTIFSIIILLVALVPIFSTLVKYDGLPADGTAEFIAFASTFMFFAIIGSLVVSIVIIRDSQADLTEESYENLTQEIQTVYGLTLSTEQAQRLAEGIRGNSSTKQIVFNGEGTEEIMRFGKFETFADDIYTHVQLARIRGQWQLLDLSEGEGGIKPLAPRETTPVSF